VSRIGNAPIRIPPGVEVTIEDSHVTVKGPKGELARDFHPDIRIEREGETILVSRPSDSSMHRSLHGTTRSLLANMIEGVANGFNKILEVSGVGYRAQLQGEKLLLQMGYSHPVEIEPPPHISFAVEGTNRIIVQGVDKELVGQVAATIRAVRKPDPYKGKGIRYSGEQIRRKAGKAGKIGGKKR
jgi:large subunit ribosomal protein L6